MTLVLSDEVLTADRRALPAIRIAVGISPAPFDIILRDYLETLDFNKTPAAPVGLPPMSSPYVGEIPEALEQVNGRKPFMIGIVMGRPRTRHHAGPPDARGIRRALRSAGDVAPRTPELVPSGRRARRSAA